MCRCVCVSICVGACTYVFIYLVTILKWHKYKFINDDKHFRSRPFKLLNMKKAEMTWHSTKRTYWCWKIGKKKVRKGLIEFSFVILSVLVYFSNMLKFNAKRYFITCQVHKDVNGSYWNYFTEFKKQRPFFSILKLENEMLTVGRSFL